MHRDDMWTDKLKQLLTDRALEYFQGPSVSYEDFIEYLGKHAFVPRWGDEFLADTFELFCLKYSQRTTKN
jgi:hypothetical protein